MRRDLKIEMIEMIEIRPRLWGPEPHNRARVAWVDR
jgi:hypothetical protein